ASTSLTNWLVGPPSPSPSAQPAPTVPKGVAPSLSGSPRTPSAAIETIAPNPQKLSSAERQRIQAYVEKQMPKLEQALPTLTEKFWQILKRSIGGFLGIAGFLLSLILVPIYLFFLLKEKPRIEKRWKDYLPLRASPLKDEVAEVLSQVNSYVVAYFRGQLLVCLVLCLGSFDRRSARAASGGAVDGNNQGPIDTLCLGPSLAAGGHGIDRGGSCRRRI